MKRVCNSFDLIHIHENDEWKTQYPAGVIKLCRFDPLLPPAVFEASDTNMVKDMQSVCISSVTLLSSIQVSRALHVPSPVPPLDDGGWLWKDGGTGW